jgi:hypothetical protein
MRARGLQAQARVALSWPTGPFCRITYALIFVISAALLLQGAVGLLRGWGMIAA